MRFGDVRANVAIPEKGARGAGFAKYPFPSLKLGESILVMLDEKDSVDIKQLKKRLTEAVRQYERRLGKVGDKKVKDFAVWIDDEEAGVFVACREDNSAMPTPTEKKAKSKKVDLRPKTTKQEG